MLLFLSLKGKTLSCSHFPTELLSHFSPLLKAKSCSHSLSISPLFPVSLKHTPVVIPTPLHHFINAALIITNVTFVLLNAINCQFSQSSSYLSYQQHQMELTTSSSWKHFHLVILFSAYFFTGMPQG